MALPEGIRKTSQLVSLGTTATKVYGVTSGRTAKLKKIWAYNSGASAATFYFTDSGGTQLTPSISVDASSHLFIKETELPSYKFSSDIYGVASATGINVMIEVEEL